MSNWTHIQHTFYQDMEDRLGEKVEAGLNGEACVQPLFGVTRSGKTYALKKIRDAYLNDEERTFFPKRLVYVAAAPQMSPSSIYVRVLDELGFGRLTSGKVSDLEARTNARLKALGTRVLFIDEVQHLVEPGRRGASRSTTDWLKFLHDNHNMTIVLAGLPIGREVLLRNEQLRDRADAEFNLRPYNWADDGERETFSRCVASVLTALEEAGGAVDVDYDTVLRVSYAVSGGRIGMLKKLFEPLIKRPHVLNQESLKTSLGGAIYSANSSLASLVDAPPSDEHLVAIHHHLLDEANEKPRIDNILAARAARTTEGASCL